MVINTRSIDLRYQGLPQFLNTVHPFSSTLTPCRSLSSDYVKTEQNVYLHTVQLASDVDPNPGVTKSSSGHG